MPEWSDGKSNKHVWTRAVMEIKRSWSLFIQERALVISSQWTIRIWIWETRKAISWTRTTAVRNNIKWLLDGWPLWFFILQSKGLPTENVYTEIMKILLSIRSLKSKPVVSVKSLWRMRRRKKLKENKKKKHCFNNSILILYGKISLKCHQVFVRLSMSQQYHLQQTTYFHWIIPSIFREQTTYEGPRSVIFSNLYISFLSSIQILSPQRFWIYVLPLTSQMKF
jgi:hypothetical protein